MLQVCREISRLLNSIQIRIFLLGIGTGRLKKFKRSYLLSSSAKRNLKPKSWRLDRKANRVIKVTVTILTSSIKNKSLINLIMPIFLFSLKRGSLTVRIHTLCLDLILRKRRETFSTWEVRASSILNKGINPTLSLGHRIETMLSKRMHLRPSSKLGCRNRDKDPNQSPKTWISNFNFKHSRMREGPMWVCQIYPNQRYLLIKR